MIQTGFESRIKVQDIIENQLPEFILDESPKLSEFLRQYYISQEFQGGTIDIVDNLDQYLKLDNLTPEVIVGFTSLSSNISSTSTEIVVSSTKGFPKKYGLLKIDDEIITYTGITTNTFTGCIRGFSGVTDYHQTLNSEELVFSESSASSHSENSKIQNLSVLFLQEFYKKLKYSLTPGFENLNFTSNLNVGNFVKEARTFYESKGTNESFRILFNILFGETPKVVDLEQFLIKPSSATYSRRVVVIGDLISGNPFNLIGQTIVKSTDEKTTASVSEVEVITRKGKTYYKFLLFVGYDDAFPTITGTFEITGSTKNLNTVSVGSSTIIVDSTIGFPPSGKIYCGNNVIEYTSKSINQFFGCSGIVEQIPVASVIRSSDTYYGYENGDLSKKVEFRLTGVLTGLNLLNSDSNIDVGEKITVKNVGELIKNKDVNPSKKEIFANSWIYNTSSRYQIDRFVSQTQFILKSDIDKSSLKVGDRIDILSRGSQTVVASNVLINSINTTNNQITINTSFTPNVAFDYDVRRKIKTSSISSTKYSLEYNDLFADVQNVYNDSDESMYVASNSLPSYQISKSIFSYNASGVLDQDDITKLYSKITFSEQVSFITGSEVYYTPSQTPISGLTEGFYYVEIVPGTNNQQVKLYLSRNLIGTDNYLRFGALTAGNHNFVLNSQKQKVLSPQKILKKFPISTNIGDGQSDLTEPGSIGMLINGVEITNYKSENQIFYGPLESVNVLSGGKKYDVINPPELVVSEGSAKVQPIVDGSVEKIYVSPQDFDINVVVSVALTGGNGSGAAFQPIIERRRREIEFDAREIVYGGGVDVSNETITFKSRHGLIDGDAIIYRPGNASPLGIGTFNGNNFDTGKTLKNEVTYYAKYINDTTIQIYESFSEYVSGINTVGFTTIGTTGVHKFVTLPKNTLREIKVINGGSGYQNRKLRVLPSGISTSNHTITFSNHGFNSGELVTYNYQTSGISGLSTEKQYYVIKVDENSFRLSDAGIGGTFVSNYQRGDYVTFTTSGSGYQIFNYPQISLNVEYTYVGIGSTQFKGQIKATPIVRGQIIDTYVYDNGQDYGSNILNYHKKPSIIVKNGKYAQLIPVVIDGRINDVSIQYPGDEYYSLPEIKVIGSGIGAILKPVVVNNKIVDVEIINPGNGYSQNDTQLIVEPSGEKVIFDPQVRSLRVNIDSIYSDIGSSTSTGELLKDSLNNLQYSIYSYSQLTRDIFNDNGSTHSPIIGWAYDGNPIYGSFGYSNPSNKNSAIKKLVSGYALDSSKVFNRPSDFSPGFFIEDYQYNNSGDLDEYNGRFCVTPEFPNGIYAYFATTITSANNRQVGSFPYFIGNTFRSKFISENKTLTQEFNFNSSSLVRNTFPYKVGDPYADNDFIPESNESINQIAVVESVSNSSIDQFEIIDPGVNYKVGDRLQIDESDTNGKGLSAEVSEIEGKDIVSLQTSLLTYNDSVFTWKNGEKVKVKIIPQHNLQDSDYVKVSGFSTSLSTLNGFYKIGVTSYTSSLISNVPNYATTGIVTDIYIAKIPESVSVGSSIKIDNEIFSILNIFKYENIIRVSRDTSGTAHTATSAVYFIPDSIEINNKVNYFDSKEDDVVYFNPNQSVGVGTISGIGVSAVYTIGIQSKTISIPTQSIYLPNHPFETNQAVTLVKPGTASSISVSNTPTSSIFDLPNNSDQQTVYIIKKSVDHIGIVTQIGLTTTSSGLYFRSNGSDDYQYYIKSNYNKIIGDVQRITAQITCEEDHDLINGDKINLQVKPNLSVGIGTSSFVRVSYDSLTNKILVNRKTFTSSGINTSLNSITINNHDYKTGDKVFYTASTVASGLSTGFYYIHKIDDNNFNLCETVIDSFSNPPLVVDILSTTSSNNQLSLVNPKLVSFRNNNLVFDLSDSSLSGYNFKVFFDNNFKDEFVSSGATSGFTVTGVGTIGYSNARVVVNCNDDISFPLFYSLEKLGVVVPADKDVINYSEINFIESYYNGSYNVSGIGSTTFNISLQNIPENNLYKQTDCDLLKYTTNSRNSSGGISKIKTISPGIGYEKLPVVDQVVSQNGRDSYIITKSNKIGAIKKFRILNEGFEYSSDKTLRPEALIPKTLTIQNFSTISDIEILDGGRNYVISPNLIIVDSKTRNKIDSGFLSANLLNSVIENVSIVASPKGLPESSIEIVATNNTNGVGIQSIQSSASGIVTCTIKTPLFGFPIEPFEINDLIFVEGIQKEGTDGDGFNSEDYGYQFFKVTNYLNGGSINPRIVEFDLSGFTTSPGTVSSTIAYDAALINYKNYPKFKVTKNYSNFIVGEALEIKLSTGFIPQDLRVEKISESKIKVSGSYELEKNQVIRGIQSGSIATINEISTSSGYFSVGYGSTQEIGWLNDIGKLDEDFQIISDNDYYQNLSYSIRSRQTWDDIVSPVNNLVHISGLKNFADTEILNSSKIISGIGTEDFTSSIVFISNENRVDTINNFDFVIDTDTNPNFSQYLQFKNKKLASYIECRTNRVLEIDDITEQLSDSTSSNEMVLKVVDIPSNQTFEKYLVQISSGDFSEVQFSEIVVLISNNDIFTLEKSVFSNTEYNIGDVYGENDESGNYFLQFNPSDPYNTTYEVKYLNSTFNNTIGVGTSSIGFVDLSGISTTVSIGSSINLFESNLSDVTSILSNVQIIDNTTNEMNYVEFFASHDGTDSYISDFYFDTTDQYSSSFIGTFRTFVSGGVFRLNYQNTSSNPVTVKLKNVGFGNTSVGIGTYRFKSNDQIDGQEKTVKYESSYSIVSTSSTVFSFDSTLFTSVKSVVKIGIGQTSSLHQVMSIYDGNDFYVLPYPFLSIGSTSGIGTFGGNLNGSVGSLIFYPDPEFSGNFEILSFNEFFYSENDFVNVPETLSYGSITDSVGVAKYVGINNIDEDLDSLSFNINYNNIPIFVKKFNPSDSSVLNLSENKFTIPNHFFSTGEELIYTPKSTLSGVVPTPVGIGSTLNNVGVVTSLLPSTVYAIKIDNDNFKIATRREYALANPAIAVTFTTTGSGNAHEFEMTKKIEKSIISIDNVVQSPVAYTLLNYTVDNGSQVSSSSTTFALSGISSIKLGDILKIDDEYMKVVNVGFGTNYSGPISFAGTFPLVSVRRGFLGSNSSSHNNLSPVDLYRGSYNIVGNQIYFTDLLKGNNNNQSILQYNLPPAKSYFNGRVFLRKDYTTNKIYDDISEQFTGIGKTYTLTVSGFNTTGLGITTGSGILFINGIFQTPSTDNNASGNYDVEVDSVTGISSIVFSGNQSSSISDYDVNTNQLPRGGIILSLGSTPGLGYAPLVGASVTAIVGAGGSIVSIGIGSTGNWGSGYNGSVSIAVTEYGHTGTQAVIQGNIGAGGTLSFSITNGGTGYSNPTINISPPNYSGLTVTGVSRLGVGLTTDTGSGLLLNIEVGASSTTGIGSTLFEVTGFKILRNGYGFKKGDVLKVVGLVTAYGISQPLNEFELNVLDVFNDSFSAWQFGEMDYIDSIKSYQDGFRRRFPLYYNSQLVSFEKDNSNPDSQLIDFNSVLLIFINGILQQPDIAYQFNGGTSVLFSEPPKKEDNVAIFFYRGSSEDSSIIPVYETIKIGDSIQVFSNNRLLGITTTQDPRTVTGITSSTQIETNIYTLQGIDEVNFKPVNWIKQKTDKIINGEIVSKARDSIEPQIYPTAKIIRNLTANQSEVFVDNAQFFNYENEVSIDFDAIIISGDQDPVSAAVTAIVSAAGTIQSLSITNAGSGYTGSSVIAKISSPKSIGVGVGTTATATISVVNGSLSTVSITNPGFGYSQLNPPQVIIPLPTPVYENITEITSVQGSSGAILGIAAAAGIGTISAVKFTLDPTYISGITTGQPIYISNTSVGNGVTSILNHNSSVVGVGTTFLDNIYIVSSFNSLVGIITCNVHSDSNLSGINTSGSTVGNFSWGKLSGFLRSSNPISIAVSGYTINSGLSSFPTIQRRGYGLRDNGSLKKIL